MKKYSMETTVGLFVLLGIFGLAYMTVNLGHVRFFSNDSYTIYARFASVSGLKVSNPVEMLGMEIGRISGFKMDQEKQVAVVELQINKDIKIYDDAIASIKTAGLIGDSYISIDPGGAYEVLKPGDMITNTEPPLDLGDLISRYVFGSAVEKQ